MYLDVKCGWNPGTAGKLSYRSFMRWLDMVTVGPDKYVFETESRNVDDTSAFIDSLNAIKQRGGNVTLANAIGNMQS